MKKNQRPLFETPGERLDILIYGIRNRIQRLRHKILMVVDRGYRRRYNEIPF